MSRLLPIASAACSWLTCFTKGINSDDRRRENCYQIRFKMHSCLASCSAEACHDTTNDTRKFWRIPTAIADRPPKGSSMSSKTSGALVAEAGKGESIGHGGLGRPLRENPASRQTLEIAELEEETGTKRSSRPKGRSKPTLCTMLVPICSTSCHGRRKSEKARVRSLF